MKKLILFLFLFFPIFVRGETLKLDDLKVLNGVLSPQFEGLNNYYTISLDKEVMDILFDYEEQDSTVQVINNYDLENNSIVFLELIRGEEKASYVFHILKEVEEEVQTVFNEEVNEPTPLMYEYKIFVIPVVCFILIFIVYKIVFRHHKK